MRNVMLVAVLTLAACGFKEPGNMCDESADCIGGLQCMQTTQYPPRCEGIIQPKLCTKACTTNADCASLELNCNRSSTCGGPADRCGSK